MARLPHLLARAVAALVPLLVHSRLQPQEVWSATTNGNWSLNSNWLDGSAPASGGGTTLSLTFLNSGASAYTAINNLGSPFTVNQLTLASFSSGTTTLANAGFNWLRLGGASPSLTQAGTGWAMLPAFTLAPSSGTVTITGSGTGNLSLNGTIAETGPQRLIINAAPASRLVQHIYLNAGNSFSGGLTLQSGNLDIGHNWGLGTGTFTVAGGTVRSTTSATVSNPVSLQADLLAVPTTSSTLTFAGAISSSTVGTGVTLAHAGTLALGGTNTYSGPTTLDLETSGELSSRPTVRLDNYGSSLFTSSFELRAGGTLALDNRNTTVLNRVGDSTPVNVRRGEISLVGNASNVSTEKVGPLSVAGHAVVTVTPGFSAGARLTLASLARTEHGTMLFRGTSLGAAFGNKVGNVLFTSSPAAQLVGGGGSGADVSIFPFAIADTDVTGGGSSFATYDAATGIRPLNMATEYAATLAAAAPTNNVRLTAAEANSTSLTINSLLLGSGGSVSGAGTLNVTSGAVMNVGAATIANDLSFGTAEAQFFNPNAVASGLVVSGAIAGSGGLTKSGGGELTLSGQNTYTGQTTINGSVVLFSSPANLGASSSAIVINADGATPLYDRFTGLVYTGTAPLDFTRHLQVNSGYGSFKGTNVTLSGGVSGAGGLTLFGNITLGGVNTYLGPTRIGGNVTVPGDWVLGSGVLRMDAYQARDGNGARITLSGDWTTNRLIVMVTRPTIDTAGFNATWNGPLVNDGASALNKIGLGELNITIASELPAKLDIGGGSVRLSGRSAVDPATVNVNSGTELVLDNGTVAVSGRLPRNAVMTLANGKFTVVGHPSTPVNEALSSLTLSGSSRSIVTLDSVSATPITATFATYTPGTAPVVFRGDNLGGATGGYTRVVFSAAPSLTNGLLPRTLADLAVSGSGASLATYDSTIDARGVVGVRPLAAAEYSGGSIIQNPANGGATRTTANFLTNGATTAGGAANTINSLTVAAGDTVTLTAGQTLTVSSAMVLGQSGGTAAITGGTVDFGSTLGVFTAAGNLNVGSALTGSSGIVKLGAGRLTLTADSSVDGPILVEDGVLRANGALSSTVGALSVSASGTLEGTGAIARAVSVSGTLAPGDAGVGTIHTGALSFSGGASLVLELTPAGYDIVDVMGAVSLTGATALSLNLSYNPLDNIEAFSIVINDGTDAVTGAFNFGGTPLVQGASFTAGGQLFIIDYTGGTGNDVYLYAVPEPSTLLLGALALPLLCRRRCTRGPLEGCSLAE